MAGFPAWILENLPEFSATLLGVLMAFWLEDVRQRVLRWRARRERKAEWESVFRTLMKEVYYNLELAEEAKQQAKHGVGFIPIRLRTGLWVATRERFMSLIDGAHDRAVDFSRFFESAEYLNHLLRVFEAVPHRGIMTSATRPKDVDETAVIAEIGRVVAELQLYADTFRRWHPDLVHPAHAATVDGGPRSAGEAPG